MGCMIAERRRKNHHVIMSSHPNIHIIKHHLHPLLVKLMSIIWLLKKKEKKMMMIKISVG